MNIAKDGLNSEMKTSVVGLDLIRKKEGFRSVAYLDPADVWTIGYGTTNPAFAFKGNKITKAKAEELFQQDVVEAEEIVKAGVKVRLNQEQFDALVSFVYNVGPGKKGVKDGLLSLKKGGQSTLLKKLNAGDFEGAALEFPKWVRAAGEVLPGLVNRRNEEQSLFLAGTIQEPELELESNVEPDVAEPPKPATTDRGVQATTAAGVAAVLSEAAKQFEPLQQYGGYIQLIFVALTIAGIIYAVAGARKGA